MKRYSADTQLVFLCAVWEEEQVQEQYQYMAQIAKEQGAIVVAMVTYPFDLERVRKVKAEEGIQKLRKYCDSVIILDNNRLVKLVPNLPMNEAFALADEVLAKAIGGLVWTITQPSLINIDFADVRSIMGNGDVGFIAVGTGKGNDKVDAAAEGVLKNKLLDVDFEGASGALIHISGGASTDNWRRNKGRRDHNRADGSKGKRQVGRKDHTWLRGPVEIVAIVTGVQAQALSATWAIRRKRRTVT